MKFTYRRAGYVPTSETLEETLATASLSKDMIEEAVDSFLTKKDAKIDADFLENVHNEGDGSITKREIRVVIEVKDVEEAPKKGKETK